jgi:hypothetical protein
MLYYIPVTTRGASARANQAAVGCGLFYNPPVSWGEDFFFLGGGAHVVAIGWQQS